MKIKIVIAVALLCFLNLPLRAQDRANASEDNRLQNLEHAVKQLQQRNSQLEDEVNHLKARSPFAPVIGGEKQPTAGNDNKAVFVAPAPSPGTVEVHAAGPEYKLTLGGYVQMNYEGRRCLSL